MLIGPGGENREATRKAFVGLSYRFKGDSAYHGEVRKTFPGIPAIQFTYDNGLAQETLWRELNIEVVKLVRQGTYSDAAEVGKRALEATEETFGPDHPNLAISLNNLAGPCKAQGRYAEAADASLRILFQADRETMESIRMSHFWS